MESLLPNQELELEFHSRKMLYSVARYILLPLTHITCRELAQLCTKSPTTRVGGSSCYLVLR
jgi:hypothetical protein